MQLFPRRSLMLGGIGSTFEICIVKTSEEVVQLHVGEFVIISEECSVMVEGSLFIIRVKEVVGWLLSFKDSKDQVSQHEPSVPCQDLEKTFMETESDDSTEGEEVDAPSSPISTYVTLLLKI
ncbi:hypothetical protein L2E82_47618 [Cichorium intybus]|uniref:Uncharacterized protein n=1 Tax=Cichorium intybus TaxID=13427 RepID=A0ACB8YV70_CICIN|nr:hypothetical protein L2E82_47618 [Cichorium intybus]